MSQILYLSKRNTTNIETAMLFINHSYRVEEPTNINEAYLDLHVVIILHKLKCCHINDEASPAPETTGGAPLVVLGLHHCPDLLPLLLPSRRLGDQGTPCQEQDRVDGISREQCFPPFPSPFRLYIQCLTELTTLQVLTINMSDCHISCVINTPW